jgi:hypothetical protein
MTPEYRRFLMGIKRSRVAAEAVLEDYFVLIEGTPEDLGRAHDLAACLVDPRRERGYMDSVWCLAHDWVKAAHDRYDVGDLVESTIEEILKALPRPSSRQAIAKNGWLWFCDQCFQRARQQAGLNGDNGYKAISARAVNDAQKQLARLDGPGPEESESDVFLDDIVNEDGAESASDDEFLSSADPDSESPLGDESSTVLHKDGHDRHTVANGMAGALGDLSPNTDYATYEWLSAFVAKYREIHVATIGDADRRTVAEAVLDGTPTSRDSKLDRDPLLEMLDHLTRDQINALKKEARLHFKAALVREAKLSGAVDDDFVRSILERSQTGTAPWKRPGLPPR